MNAPVKAPVILSALVDRLAAVKAAAADLAAEEKALKAELIAAGLPVIEGSAHTVTGAPYHVIRVSARKGA